MNKTTMEAHVKVLKELTHSEVSGIIDDDVLTVYVILIRILMQKIREIDE
jgi:hypothetical protein